MPIPEDKRVDHLILLVGGNPLPNYVAAKTLGKNPKNIHLVHTNHTEDVAKKLQEFIDSDARPSLSPLSNETNPQEIRECLKNVINGLGSGSVGLHYTGGTKMMAAQAHRAARDAKSEVTLSYLDARTLCMYFENSRTDVLSGPEKVIDDPRVALTVQQALGLHGISLKLADGSDSFSKSVSANRYSISNAILHSDIARWKEWISKNLRGWDKEKRSLEFLKGDPLKAVQIPVEEFPEVAGVFKQLGATKNTLQEWAGLAEFKMNSKGVEEFAKFIEGGWLEACVFSLIEQISAQADAPLTDVGMNYSSFDGPDQLFEFDVAATRGYRLYAISCTTSSNKDLCKSKLFEAYYRASQMGGDEARVALVCAHPDPEGLYRKFRREFKLHEEAAKIFTIDHVRKALTDTGSFERKEFAKWLLN